MKKFICMAVAMLLIASCGTSKKATEVKDSDYKVEEVELTGIGRGTSSDWNMARSRARTLALGDLSVQIDARVSTASSDYMKQKGYDKVLFESLTEVVSKNRLQGVSFKYDGDGPKARKKNYLVIVTAKLNQVFARKTVDGILNDLDITDEERDAFRREMFGSSL